MKKVKLSKEGKLFGIMEENETIFIPHAYKNPIDAIIEWKHFQLDNRSQPMSNKYLDTNRMLGEIYAIEKSLRASVKKSLWQKFKAYITSQLDDHQEWLSD